MSTNIVSARSKQTRAIESLESEIRSRIRAIKKSSGVQQRSPSTSYADSLTTRTRPAGAPPPKIGGASAGAPNINSVGIRGLKLLLSIGPHRGGPLGRVATELALHDLQLAYRLYKLSKKEPRATAPINTRSFTGGQSPNVVYRIESSYVGPYDQRTIPLGDFFGPIKSVYIAATQAGPVDGGDAYFIVSHGDAHYYNAPPVPSSEPVTIKGHGFGGDSNTNSITSIKITRVDGQPDTDSTPTTYIFPASKTSLTSSTVAGEGLQPANTPNQNKNSKTQPGVAVQPNEQNKRKPVKIQVPANTPIQFTFDESTNLPPFKFETAKPSTVSVGPSRTNETTGKSETPVNVTVSGQQPVNLTLPGTNPISINVPNSQPITVNPTGTTKTTGLTPSTSTPGASTPTPANPTGPTTPTIPKTTDQKLTDIETKLNEFTPLLLGIPALLPLLKGLPQQTTDKLTPEVQKIPGQVSQTLKPPIDNIEKNTTPEAQKKAAAEGTCETLKPDGCMRDEFDDLGQTMGKDQFPMLLPEYLSDDFMDKQVAINNQVEFNGWLVKNLDNLFGLFPIKIERTDENGTKHTIKFENIAEAFAEIFGFLSQIAFDADTAVNVGVHATAEAVGGRIAALQAGDYIKAIIDYLGFQKENDSFNVNISCTPGATGTDGKLQESELDDFLKPSVQKVIGINCKEQNDLHTIIKRILFAAEIMRTALYKPLKPDQVTKENRLTGDAIREHKKKEKKKSDEQLTELKRKYESQTGFDFDIDIVEVTDTTPKTP